MNVLVRAIATFVSNTNKTLLGDRGDLNTVNRPANGRSSLSFRNAAWDLLTA
jgi:hypothetical protein